MTTQSCKILETPQLLYQKNCSILRNSPLLLASLSLFSRTIAQNREGTRLVHNIHLTLYSAVNISMETVTVYSASYPSVSFLRYRLNSPMTKPLKESTKSSTTQRWLLLNARKQSMPCSAPITPASVKTTTTWLKIVWVGTKVKNDPAVFNLDESTIENYCTNSTSSPCFDGINVIRSPDTIQVSFTLIVAVMFQETTFRNCSRDSNKNLNPR